MPRDAIGSRAPIRERPAFSRELLDEWDWEEHFAGQPETERYLNHVADKFDLRRDIQFKSRVAAANYRENTRSWDIALEDGRRYNTSFLVTAVGVLSAATLPNIPGVENFQRASFHTHCWPNEPVSFAGKRVAVIGTGATGIQGSVAWTDHIIETSEGLMFAEVDSWMTGITRQSVI